MGGAPATICGGALGSMGGGPDQDGAVGRGTRVAMGAGAEAQAANPRASSAAATRLEDNHFIPGPHLTSAA
ncbi:MAG TPA: hypothetical protein VG841_00740 [Caulobacterales bacterium]|nr:hypothetical protein [Caulobacterales bacterium]